MHKLSDNYYLRKCYLKTDQVPTQTVMKSTMSPALANVYFDSMNAKLKIIAGLAPPLLGSRDKWFQPPNEILKGKSALKPIKENHAKLLSCDGIYVIGESIPKLINLKHEQKVQKVLKRVDRIWKLKIIRACNTEFDERSREAAAENTQMLKDALQSFAMIYRTSLTRIEEIFMTIAVYESENLEKEIFKQTKEDYSQRLKLQAMHLQKIHFEKLSKETERLKLDFMEQVGESKSDMVKRVHDLRVERCVLVEKIRQLVESQKLACQIYVAMKEREECAKEMELLQHNHKKKIKKAKEQIAVKDFELKLEQEKARNRIEFARIWQKKICKVVKRFQMFVSFCLNTLPEYAEFFMDMEKLMLLQLSEAIDLPTKKSIIQVEESKHVSRSECPRTPLIPKPHPYYLCCVIGHKPTIDQELCPKHCTSSTSQMPVVVVNKRCIYSACDNFKIFIEKYKQFFDGRRDGDDDFTDLHNYENDVPIKISSTQQLLELKLESSILQILQNELPTKSELPIECPCCKLPHCFPHHTSKSSIKSAPESRRPSYWALKKTDRVVTRHEIEQQLAEKPAWVSYLEFRHPEECCYYKCQESARKRLDSCLPTYMRDLPRYVTREIPGYVMCKADTLIHLVKEAHGDRTPPPAPVSISVKDASSQYSDQDVDLLCTCFSDIEADKILAELLKGKGTIATVTSGQNFKVTGEGMTNSFMHKTPCSFAENCGFSLVSMLDNCSVMKEIFKKPDCTQWFD